MGKALRVETALSDLASLIECDLYGDMCDVCLDINYAVLNLKQLALVLRNSDDIHLHHP